jgi:vitamin B12 transporter
MNKKHKFLVAAGMGIAQVLSFNTSFAQQAKELDEVVIMATKNDQKQSQTGKVVTVVTREQLDRSSGKTLPELLSEQAGVIVGGATSNQGLNKGLFIRGAGSAYAVVLIDGIIVGNPSGVGSSFDLRMFGIDQIDHIEILKGGQSTIYGSDAVGGVINIITKKGTKGGNNVFGSASAGSYNTYKGTIGINSQVDNFSYNIGFTQAKTAGISEAANPPGSTAIFDKDGNRTAAVNANFSLQASKNFSISPFLRYFYGHYDFDANAFEDNLSNNYKLKHFNGGFNTRYEFTGGKLNLNYSYENTFNDSQNQYGASLSQGKMNILDLFYNQKLGSNLNLLVGADNRVTSLQGSYFATTNLFSTYTSLFLHDAGMFNLEVGARYNKHKQYGENYTYSITPSINLLKGLKVFGTISTNFKAPTLDMLFGLYGANLNLQPEKSKNYEGGLNLSLVDEKFSIRLAGFKRDLTNAIVYGNVGYVNQLSQHAKGFELEPSVRLNKLNIKGFYSYVMGSEFNFVNNAMENTLFRRPKHTIGVNAGVQATDNLFISANFKYLGKRSDGDFDFSNPRVVTLPAFKLVDVYGEYAFAGRRLRVFADLKNILNEKYTEYYGYNSMGFNVNAGVNFNFR